MHKSSVISPLDMTTPNSNLSYAIFREGRDKDFPTLKENKFIKNVQGLKNNSTLKS